jgi:hypothetical protein
MSLHVSTDDISDEKGVSVSQYSSEGLSDLQQSFRNFKLIESTTKNVLATLPAYKLIYILIRMTILSLKRRKLGL